MSVQVVTEPGVDSEQPGVEQPATEQTAIGQPAAEQPPVTAAGAPQLPDFAAGWHISAPQAAIELESAASSHFPTAGSREVSFGDPNAWSSRCTRIEPLPRPKRSTWRGMRADRVLDRFSCAGEHVRGRVRRELVLGNGWES